MLVLYLLRLVGVDSPRGTVDELGSQDTRRDSDSSAYTGIELKKSRADPQ